jgi:hypothetical protein
MATIQQPPAKQTQPNWRRWSYFFAGMVTGCLLPLALAYCFGPKSTAVYEDPLTGRRMRESIWLDLTLSRQIEENEVSKWADGNSIPEVYPARFGWTAITREERGWFSRRSIACGGGYDIPNRILRGQIAIEGLTPEKTLQKYQTEFIAAFNEHESAVGIQRAWSAKQQRR